MLHKKIEQELKTLLADKTADIELRNAYKLIVAEFQRESKPISSDKRTLEILTKLKKGETELYVAKAKRASLNSIEPIVIPKDATPLLEVLDKYLPKQLSKTEIIAWIESNINFSKLRNPMQAIGLIKKEFGNKVDGDIVKQCVQCVIARES